MRKHILSLVVFLLSVFALGALTTSVYAAGDKVRGDKAEGPAYQECESNDGDCPFTG